MPWIHFHKKNKSSLEVTAGVNLMKALLEGGLPVASSCAGDGVCAKCKIKIISGAENLNVPNETELFLKKTNSISSEDRISCQTEVIGDITVDASYW